MAEQTPFSILEQTFALLGAEPHPLTLDGRLLRPELPARPIPIGELRAIVWHPATSPDLQARIIQAVVDQLRSEDAAWIVVLAGLLLPGMQCLATHTTRSASQASASHRVQTDLLTRVLFASRRPPRDTRRFAVCLLELARS
jgi:hypothetical protein